MVNCKDCKNNQCINVGNNITIECKRFIPKAKAMHSFRKEVITK